MLGKLATEVRDGFSGSLVLIGEPGVGKTRLLQYVADSATGVRILWIVGAQSELRLGFAALHRLLMPYLSRLDRLSGPHRNALEVTFGLTEGPPPNRFLVSLAALALLSDVAAERPVLCLIDDAQWLDQESLAVLGFIARRLYADPIGMVFSAREHAGDLTALDGIGDPAGRCTGSAVGSRRARRGGVRTAGSASLSAGDRRDRRQPAGDAGGGR